MLLRLNCCSSVLYAVDKPAISSLSVSLSRLISSTHAFESSNSLRTASISFSLADIASFCTFAWFSASFFNVALAFSSSATLSVYSEIISFVSAVVPSSVTRFNSLICVDWDAIVSSVSSNLRCSSSFSWAWLDTILRNERTLEELPSVAVPSVESSSESSSPRLPAKATTTQRRTRVTL